MNKLNILFKNPGLTSKSLLGVLALFLQLFRKRNLNNYFPDRLYPPGNFREEDDKNDHIIIALRITFSISKMYES